MRTIITAKKLADALPALLSIIPKKPKFQVLENIQCVATKEGIRLRASNLTSFLTVHIQCEVIKTGSCCIPAKLFSDIITKQAKNSGDLTLILEDTKLSICGKEKQVISVISDEEFIEFPLLGSTFKDINVNGIEFFNKAKTLCNYVCKNNSDISFNSVHLASGKLVACDSYKLAYADLKVNEDAPNVFISPDLIQVLGKLNLVKKLANLESEDITIKVLAYPYEDDRLIVSFDNWELIQKTSKYKPLPLINLDKTTAYTDLEFDRQQLLSKIKAAIVCSDSKLTRLWLHLQNDNLYFVTANSQDYLTASGSAVSYLIEAEQFLKIVDSLKAKTVKLKLPHTRNLIGIEVDDFNLGLFPIEPKDSDNEILEELNTEGTTEIVTSLEVDSNTLISAEIRNTVFYLQNLLESVTDVQLKEAIVKEVLAIL